MSEPARRAVIAAVRVAISVVLLWWLGRQLGGGWTEVRGLRPLELVPAALVFSLSNVLGAWQWILLLRRAGIEVPARRLHALYWVGLFFNNFLPSNVGGDLVKVADVAVNTGRVSSPLAATLVDRMLGLCALVGLAFVAAGVLGDRAPAGLPWWALGGLALTVLGAAAVLLSGRLGRWGSALIRRLRQGRRSHRLEGLLEETRTFRADPGFVLRIAGLALVVQAMRVHTHVLVADAMGLPLGAERVLQLYVLVPVLGVAVVLPLSFNGLGIRELVATRLMPAIGIAGGQAFAWQIATYLVQVAVSLIGGVVFAFLLSSGRLRWRRSGGGGGTGA